MLTALHRAAGAVFAEAEALPRHYGDPAGEYHAAHHAAVLVDRSDEGRLMLEGADRLAILHRISTNEVTGLQPGEGRASVLVTPVGRIIDRLVLHNLDTDRTLVRAGAGRGGSVAAYLRRNIFFRDRMQVQDISDESVTFMLYGPQAYAIAETLTLIDGLSTLPLHHVKTGQFNSAPLIVFAADSPGVPAIGLVISADRAGELWAALLTAGQPGGLRPTGHDVVEMLRIEAALPGAGAELTEDFIPLEAGLWADVSFTKGCYTGQEILARMESRGKLAKTLVGLELSGAAQPGAPLKVDGRNYGVMTSCTRLPDGRWIGLGFIKPEFAVAGQAVIVGEDMPGVVSVVP
ncbi:MAG: glycine cleavage T C-terminal barrel domain-containing protein [Anaerolineae bacterium]